MAGTTPDEDFWPGACVVVLLWCLVFWIVVGVGAAWLLTGR